MTTTIIHNGHEWFDKPPEPIDTLLAMLAREPLDPVHEPFIIERADAVSVFSGNFHTVAHPFTIETDDPAVCKQLTEAIRANQKTAGYREAVQACRRWQRGNDFNDLVSRLSRPGRFRNAPRLR